MKSKLASNPAKKILCLALCAIMLIAMLPAMAVPAYAADEDVEIGSVWIQYVDADTLEEIAEPTLLHYEDLPDGLFTMEDVPDIEGYTIVNTQRFVEGAIDKDHAHVTKTGAWRYSDFPISYQLSDENDWGKFRLIYNNDKADSGYIKINSDTYYEHDPSWTDMTDIYYYDDMTNGEYSIDLNKAGYQIMEIYEEISRTPITVPTNGILTGTLVQGDVHKLTVYYVPDTNTSSFNSVLLLNENSSVPNATINYSIEPGTGIAAVPGTSMAVLAPSTDTGVTGAPTISNAVFAPGDATVTSVEGVTIDAGEKAVVKPISVDFSGVTFAQPGIFRYVISEPSSGNNMTYDTQLNDTTNGTRYQRVLDVYVVRNASDEYEIGGYVLHEVAGAVNEGETTAADKSSGFVNEYNTTGLTLECQVEGNQSSIDKYFAYTITMQNPGNSAFNVTADWSNASGAQNPVSNPATSYTNEAITAANTNEWTSNADGSMSKTIYLKDGQKVALDGIPVGTAYSITVAEEDYGPSWVVGSDNGSNDATGNRSLGDTEDVVFTLTREGVVPTGVALSILPGVIIMGAAAAFLFVMKNRKREEGANA